MKVFIEDFRTGETLKRCSKCGQYKKLGEYRKHKRSSHGVESRCKECLIKQKRKYRNAEDWFWKRFWPNTIRSGDCLIWTGKCNISNQPVCRFDGKEVRVRRLVYRFTCGDLPDDMFVLMTCRNSRCLSQYHMRRASKAERDANLANSASIGDQHRSRTHPELLLRGERNGHAKLTEEKVRTIRELRCQGMTLEAIAQSVGSPMTTVHSVVSGRTWAHVQ